MSEPHVTRSHARLTEAGARAILDAARAKAAAMGVPQCIAIVDDGGNLLAFTRMDGARIGSTSIALTKAISAATRRRPTGDESGGDVLAQVRLALAADAVTGIGGGVPISVSGEVVGAIGVSSAPSPDTDTEVAMAGIEALRTS